MGNGNSLTVLQGCAHSDTVQSFGHKELNLVVVKLSYKPLLTPWTAATIDDVTAAVASCKRRSADQDIDVVVGVHIDVGAGVYVVVGVHVHAQHRQ